MATIQPFSDEVIQKLVALDMQKEKVKLRALSAQKQATDVKISLYGNLKSFIDNFQKSLNGLGDAFNTLTYQASMANAGIANVSLASNGLLPGNHSLIVNQLAQGQTSVSSIFTSPEIDSGASPETLTFNGSGSTTFSINVTAGESLQDIAKDINNHHDNFGITASVITSYASDNVTPQYSLSISSNKTGADAAFTMTGDTGSLINLTQTVGAQNALYSLDGYNEVSTSNSTTGVIDGLTINLLTTGSTSINVTEDKTNQIAAVNTAITNMIAAYNQMIGFMDGAQSDTGRMDPNDNTKWLSGTSDPVVPYIKSLMDGFIKQSYAGAGTFTSLFEIGIDTAKYQKGTNPNTDKDYNITGLIQIDPNVLSTGMTTLTNNLTNNFDAVRKFFTDPTNGLIAKMNTSIHNTIMEEDSNGAIWRVNDAATLLDSKLDDDIHAENARLSETQKYIQDKYANLNAIISKFSSISQALTNTFAMQDSSK